MNERDCTFVIMYGALRSGSTLLRLMLDQHSAFSCPGEVDFLFDYLSIDESGAVEIDAEALGRNRIYQDSSVILQAKDTPREVLLGMISQLRRKPNQLVVLILHRGIEKALSLFPNTPVLHLLRDPRDVARSSIGMGWAGTTFHGVEHWIKTEQEWIRALENNPEGFVETLHYEELILNAREELDRVCNFFGVEFEEEMLSYYASSTYSKPDPTLIEQWRNKQSPRELALVEGRLGEMLSDCGYSPSGHAPYRPGQAESFLLLIVNKWSIWRKRISRYGLLDPLSVAVTRRLGIPSLGYRAKERMNNKQKTFRK